MLRKPRAGEKITASWAAELVREVRRNRPIAGKNVKISVTPNGTILSGTPGGETAGAAAGDKGCFAIVEKEPAQGDNATGGSVKLKNCFYRVAGRTFALNSELNRYGQNEGEEGDELSQEAELSLRGSAFLCLNVDISRQEPSASLVQYESLSDLNNEENDLTRYVAPLYFFDDHLNVLIDFRVGANLIMAEFIEQ